VTNAPAVSVSVVIPCYNQARFLPDAIGSVAAQQLGEPLTIELIVVDDGSTDDTARVATGLGARVIRQRNRGLSNARNAGLTAARGDLVVFLDADDMLTHDALATGAAAFASRPDLACVLRHCVLMDAAGQLLPTDPPDIVRPDIYAELLHRNITWTPGAAVFRRAEVLGAGGFAPDVSPASDYALYLRFARAGRLEYQHMPAALYRQHGASMSRDPLVMLRATLSVLAAESCALPSAYRKELIDGRREWCNFYGDQIVDEMRRDWRDTHRPRVLARRLLSLLRHSPRVAARHAGRKLSRLVRGLPAARLDPPARIAAPAASRRTRDRGR
jgi:glycosyltransferase involved in cell wall biosynthesis